MEGAFTVKRLLDAGRVQAIALAPSGTWAAIEMAQHDPDAATLVPHLHRVELESGKVTPLTSGPHGCHSPGFRSDGTLAFLTSRPVHGYIEGVDEREDEKHEQVWVMPEHGEARPLTNEPLGVISFRFAKASDVLVVLAHALPGVPYAEQRRTARDLAKHGPSALRYGSMPARQWDHWVGRAAPHLVLHDPRGRRDLTPAADRELREWALPHGHQWTLSPDGRFVVTEWQSIGSDRIPNVRLVAIDVESMAMRDLVRVDPLGFATAPVLSRDGKTLACNVQRRSPERYGKVELAIADVSTGTLRILGGDFDRWLVPEDFTPDGARIVATAETDATVAVFAIDVEKGQVSRITPPSAGGSHVQLAVHPDGRSIVGLRHTLLHPPEPFQVPLHEGSEPFIVARLSSVEAQDYDVSSFETKMEDGAMVQSLLVRPKGSARPPVLFWIHGGPVGQFADAWHWRWNPLVFASEGYAVVLPNPRGSTGRGQAFVEGIWGNVWGATCFDDLMTVADAVAARADLDGKNMSAMGGSFGGYMSNWIGSQTDRFACIMTHASVFHLEQFAQTTDIPAWFFLESGLAPPEGRDELDRYSPHRYIGQWKTPTLVIHGEKDYRVPISEALSLFESLQRRNVESELLVFPDEGHWIMRPRNITVWYDAVVGWMNKHMKRDA